MTTNTIVDAGRSLSTVPETWPETTPVVEVFVDHEGNVHERAPESPGRTLCGLNAGASNEVVGARPCRACVVRHFEVVEALVVQGEVVGSSCGESESWLAAAG
ncbi:hypothetical protein [Saccharopolyspora pogona]|uniref:hypothetical protein n=1 Tax=Saccharopolyspora pogona TaxID=333966 RepID=UPI001685E7C4|nr:hypothetical protein [Saccharopolyspora pogona]